MNQTNFNIDYNEQFSHLSKAPIVEAVIDVRFVLKKKWDESFLRGELQTKLPNYPKIEALRESKVQISAQKPEESIFEDLGCVGLKLHCKENPYIVQFNKGAFVFSRLMPYEDWDKFTEEAFRLLQIYSELLEPIDIKRVGLRFINSMVADQEKVELSDYYKNPPTGLNDFNGLLADFFHRDVIQVPGSQYSVNLIKTVQKDKDNKTGLILDIDVFMVSSFQYDVKQLGIFLKEMRWVKNKMFFSSIIEKKIEELK